MRIFKLIVGIALVILLMAGGVSFNEWRVTNLEKTYTYNFEGINFFDAFFMGNSAGQVFLWRHYKNLVLIGNLLSILLFTYYLFNLSEND